MAILAAGVGFALRGGIFGAWASEYGFTASQLGAIGGAGFSGFCFGIIIGGVVCDKIGYGKLVIAAFLFHVLSFVVTMMIAKRSQPHFVAQWKWTGLLNGHVEESYTGHELVKVFGHRRESIAQFDHANDLMYETLKAS